MKLFVIAALVAVAAAGRLENLERSYLPSNQSTNGSLGSPSSHESAGTKSGAIDAAGADTSIASATSNQYLPAESSASEGVGAHNAHSQQNSGHQAARSEKHAAPSSEYESLQTASSIGAPSYQAQLPQQPAAARRQYLAPRTSSSQNPSQQAFDEETGYQYSAPQFANSLQGISAQNLRNQQYSTQQAAPAQNYAAPSSQYESLQAASSFGAPSSQFPQQPAVARRQNLAPRTSFSQNPPQQAFDEETGYQYGGPQFAGSLQGPAAQNLRSQQYSRHQVASTQQYAAPRSQYGSLQTANSFNAPNYQALFPQQPAAARSQYLAPRTSSFQNLPQQAFDEETGYHY